MVREIVLKRKNVTIPDNSLKLYVVYVDIGNPLTDSSGNVQYTSELDENSQLIPEYPEYPVIVDIPENTVPSSDAITALLADALEIAKTQAQARANTEEAKAAFKPFVDTFAADKPIEFEGTVELLSSAKPQNPPAAKPKKDMKGKGKNGV